MNSHRHSSISHGCVDTWESKNYKSFVPKEKDKERRLPFSKGALVQKHADHYNCIKGDDKCCIGRRGGGGGLKRKWRWCRLSVKCIWKALLCIWTMCLGSFVLAFALNFEFASVISMVMGLLCFAYACLETTSAKGFFATIFVCVRNLYRIAFWISRVREWTRSLIIIA